MGWPDGRVHKLGSEVIIYKDDEVRSSLCFINIQPQKTSVIY